MKMASKIIYISCIVTIYISLDFAYQVTYAEAEIQDGDLDFDYLMFTQAWPVTVCKLWMEINSSHHCVFPKNEEQWTIHGVWPLKYNGWLPSDCNDSWAFDPEKIKSLEEDLDQVWPNIYIESERYSFWEHEWKKHGPCGIRLEPLNSEYKYFRRGIELTQEYLLSDMLRSANIIPSDTNELTIEEITNAVEVTTDRLPMISCALLEGEQWLQEIRICFDKQMNLIDCESSSDGTCNVSRGIIYPTRTKIADRDNH